MDHLKTYVNETIGIYFILDEHEEEIKILLKEKDFGYQSFAGFLRETNWNRTQEGRLERKSHSNKKKDYDMPQILQAWLFFALIASIVRTDKTLFGFKDLVKGSDHGGKFLTTKTLPDQLQTWHDWMKTSLSRTEAQERLIDADRTLELARRVVRANLVDARFTSKMDMSLSGDAWDEASSLNGTLDHEVSSDSEFERETGEKPQPELALCLMLLGETLSAAKTQLMNDLGLKINGWLTDDDSGWGPPSYLLTKMREKKWCPRARKVLRGQLGSSAFLLFVAFAQQTQGGDAEQHDNCTAEKCVELQGQMSRAGDESIGVQRGSYVPQHHKQRCWRKNKCCEIGPEMEDVYSILEGANLATEAYEFPLFRIISENPLIGQKSPRHSRVIGITVETWSREDNRELRRPDFATISHVWSQGMGNERSNGLQECQLKFLRDVLDKVGIEDKDRETPGFVSAMVKRALGEQHEGDRYKLSPPFWMDTLAVPVSDQAANAKIKAEKFTELKQRAIRQIYHVYNSATRVIVIDKELCKTPTHELASIVIIKILTSAWMRRLWTLQEAFLSRRLSIAFGKNEGVVLVDVDDRISKLGTVKDGDSMETMAFQLSMAELIKHKLYHNLMGEDREIRNRKDHPIETRGSMVIASAWRSSRWRSTSRLEDETLALSTLLNLDYRTTLIERGGEIAKLPNGDRKYWRERMMRDFWTLIHRSYEGSIPAGLIFLPGERLSVPGFGWAPTTWLSGKDEDHPYPLDVIGKPTELHQEGLLVQYPGFLLHGGDPYVVLRSNYVKEDLKFPIDQYLSEWYKATATKERTHDQAAQKIMSRLRPTENIQTQPKRPQFGIILSRPKPREWPPEIGLLVEIYSEMSRRKEPQRVNRKIYCCQIIRRLWVSRATNQEEEPEYSFRLPRGEHKDSPIGELMPEHTLWYVDGYQDIDTREESRRPGAPGGAEDKKGSIKDNLDQNVSQKLGYQFPGERRGVKSEAKNSVGGLPDRRNSKEVNGTSSSQIPAGSDRQSTTTAQEAPADTTLMGSLMRRASDFNPFGTKPKRISAIEE